MTPHVPLSPESCTSKAFPGICCDVGASPGQIEPWRGGRWWQRELSDSLREGGMPRLLTWDRKPPDTGSGAQQRVPEPWDLSLRLSPVCRSPRATRVPKTKNEATRTDHTWVKMTSCRGCTSLQGDIKKRFVGTEEDSKDQSPLSSTDFTTKKAQERAPALHHPNLMVDFISLPPIYSEMFQCGDRELGQQSLKI